MGEAKIEKLEELISPHLKDGETITDCNITRLTAPGENYGSLMLKVDITIKNAKNNEERILKTAAKKIPPNAFVQEMFNTQVTFKNEIAFYSKIVPILKEFQEECGMKDSLNYFPKMYGARINLNPKSEKVDENAVLMLENLKVLGYKTVERTEGFDCESSKLILKDLANFHATSLALKLKKRETFEKTIAPYLVDFFFNEAVLVFVDEVLKIMDENAECSKLKERARTVLSKKSVKIPHEPWDAIIHNDFWVNNTMLKFVCSKPVRNKIVDFQVCEYKSPLRDLLFFLFSSLSTENLDKNLDNLLDYYYENFISNLEQLNCDTRPFSRGAFDKQLFFAANESEFFHVLIMFGPIFAHGELKEIDSFDPKDMKNDMKFSEKHKEKIWHTTIEFAKRGWI